jgi:hypothetical protein
MSVLLKSKSRKIPMHAQGSTTYRTNDDDDDNNDSTGTDSPLD